MNIVDAYLDMLVDWKSDEAYMCCLELVALQCRKCSRGKLAHERGCATTQFWMLSLQQPYIQLPSMSEQNFAAYANSIKLDRIVEDYTSGDGSIIVQVFNPINIRVGINYGCNLSTKLKTLIKGTSQIIQYSFGSCLVNLTRLVYRLS